MRVLQVLSSLNRISGVANVVMNYYRMLKDNVTFDFLLYSEVEDSFAAEAESYGSKIYYIPKFSIKTYGKYKKDIKGFFAKHGKEYDLVHIHELLSQRIIVPVAHRHGLKVVMHSHGPYPDRKMVGTVKAVRNKFLLKGFDKNADFYLACSERAGKAFKKQKNVLVLKNGVDVKRYLRGNGMRDELGVPQSAYVVGFVGRITEQKNPAAIIDIFAEVNKQRGNSVLVMAGEGDSQYVEIVKSLVKKYGLEDSVKMIGNCKRIPELMRSIDAFFMPSLWEGLPVVLVEAQAAGLPCYCSENVPREGDLTGNVKFLSLDTDYKIWAKEILSGQRTDEKQVLEGFRKTGYDLGSNAQTLLEIYRGVTERE